MKRKITPVLYILIFAVLTLSSCSKKKPEAQVVVPVEIKIPESNHVWYSFGKDGFSQINLPQNASYQPFTPWTEAYRISSANTTSNDNGETEESFAIVNRLGVLCFDNDKVTLARDVSLFNDRTAGNLVFYNNTPVFSVYKSAFFNDTITDPNYKSNDSLHLFLVQFDSRTRVAYPILNSTNLTDEINSEVTDYVWDGYNWYCSIKTISDVKNSFSYVKWTPSVPLLSLSPNVANNDITVLPSSQDEFRGAKTQYDYKDAPERIKKLVAGFSSSKPFMMDIKAAGGFSSQKYYNSVAGSKEKDLNAKAIIAQSWSAALFEDGTLFMEGALPGRHILRGGKPIAIRLPKLPAGFVYSDFVISGTTLYAAWEEIDFYRIGKSGFLKVDLDKTLYSKLR